MIPVSESENYFDEAYFQRGWERGTAYDNYKENAEASPTFREIARAISTIFKPRRALEIGCATGAIVVELNRLGVDTAGIDVSKWAVENALHANVINASAADLPFKDATFDFLYSSHALEHLPRDIYADAFREIDRVSGPDAVQFHMLPIIGTYPYDYDHAAARKELQKDPTHNLLETMSWWRESWSALGWEHLPISILLADENENAELSSGQFCLVRKNSQKAVALMEAIDAWNGAVYREKYTAVKKYAKQRATPLQYTGDPDGLFPRLGPEDDKWNDLKREFSAPVDLENAEITVLIQLKSGHDVEMRIALISENDDVSEKWLVIPPGISVYNISASDFVVNSGVRALERTRAIYFGGTIGDFAISANITTDCPGIHDVPIFLG